MKFKRGNIWVLSVLRLLKYVSYPAWNGRSEKNYCQSISIAFRLIHISLYKDVNFIWIVAIRVFFIISLWTFFRQLRCERITIHKNLFTSYVLTGISWILYYVLVALDGDVLLDNPVRDLLNLSTVFVCFCSFNTPANSVGLFYLVERPCQ